MILGSEGRLGVITEVTAQVHRIPEKRDIYAYFFPNWEAGIAAMQAIAESDATPSITRVSDARETGFSLATAKERKGMDKFLAGTVLPSLMRRKGWKDLTQICLSFIGYEGGKEHASARRSSSTRSSRSTAGWASAPAPACSTTRRSSTPRTCATSCSTGARRAMSRRRRRRGRSCCRCTTTRSRPPRPRTTEIGIKGWIMAHLSHSYHSGACLYFTFAFVFSKDPLAEYDQVKSAIQQSFVDNGGTISHHHGVGVEHAQWLDGNISTQGVGVMRRCSRESDPGDNSTRARSSQAASTTRGEGGPR